MKTAKWLMKWNQTNCANKRICMESLDNPGWAVHINLKDVLVRKDMQEVNIDYGDDDWIVCKMEDGYFKGYGDPSKLLLILQTFRKIVDSNYHDEIETNLLLVWFMKWYEAQCDGEWEHMFGITICSDENASWHVDIDLNETNWEFSDLQPILFGNRNQNWMEIKKIQNKSGYNKFIGNGDSEKLLKILRKFYEFIQANS